MSSPLLSVGRAQVFRIAGVRNIRVAGGTLEFHAGDEEQLVITCSGFQCTLTGKEVPSLKVDTRRYVIRLPVEQFYGITIDEGESADTLEEIDDLLDAYTDFRIEVDVDMTEDEAAAAFDAPTIVSPAVARSALSADTTVAVTSTVIIEHAPAAANMNSKDLAVRTLNKTSQGLTTGSQALAGAIDKGSAKLGRAIHNGKRFLMRHIPRRERPVQVPSAVKTGLKCARQLTGVAAQATAAVVHVAKVAAVAAGGAVAAAINETPLREKLDSTGTGPRMTAAKEMGMCLIDAADTVFSSLVNAGRDLLRNLSDATVDVVEHRYGEDAAEATADLLGAAGNIAGAGIDIAIAVQSGVTTVARLAIQQTVVGVVTGDASPSPEYAVEAGVARLTDAAHAALTLPRSLSSSSSASAYSSARSRSMSASSRSLTASPRPPACGGRSLLALPPASVNEGVNALAVMRARSASPGYQCGGVKGAPLSATQPLPTRALSDVAEVGLAAGDAVCSPGTVSRYRSGSLKPSDVATRFGTRRSTQAAAGGDRRPLRSPSPADFAASTTRVPPPRPPPRARSASPTLPLRTVCQRPLPALPAETLCEGALAALQDASVSGKEGSVECSLARADGSCRTTRPLPPLPLVSRQ